MLGLYYNSCALREGLRPFQVGTLADPVWLGAPSNQPASIVEGDTQGSSRPSLCPEGEVSRKGALLIPHHPYSTAPQLHLLPLLHGIHSSLNSKISSEGESTSYLLGPGQGVGVIAS